MICPTCGSTRTAELAEYWSAWGLHKLGLAEPEISISIICMGCGFSVSDCATRLSEGLSEQNVARAIKRAEKRFSDGNKHNSENQISWDSAIRLFPELETYYQERAKSNRNRAISRSAFPE